MPVLLILMSVVILVGVVGVAIGRGGEMAEFTSDYPPFEAGDLMTAADVALLHPPSALWGYNVQATDEALGQIAQVVTERDVEIAALRRQLAELRTDPAPAAPARTDAARADAAPAAPRRADAAPAAPRRADAAPAAAARADAAPVDPASADPASADPARAAAAPAPVEAASPDAGTGSGG